MSEGGKPVRGRTRPGRLAALDAWLAHEAAPTLAAGGLVIDLGFGVSAITVEELARAVHAVNPGLRVLGLERDSSRLPPTSEGCELQVGDFTTLRTFTGVAVLRAMNVLRAYREAELPAIREALLTPLGPHGLLLEGSTDTEGHVTAVHLVRGGRDELLLHTDLSRGFSPWLFRDVLPRDLRRSVKPGQPIHSALTLWAQAVEALGDGRTPLERLTVPRLPFLDATEWERTHHYLRLRLEDVPRLTPSFT